MDYCLRACCLPSIEPVIAAWRLSRALIHILCGWWTMRWRFNNLTNEQKNHRVVTWAQELLSILNITLEVQGHRPHSSSILLISNHISWLDILVIHASFFCRFISKSDVLEWPLIGYLSQSAGTLFIERSQRKDALRVVNVMSERLKAGDVLAIFPEGTTSDGLNLLPFHSNLLQAAITSGSQVVPLALCFKDLAEDSLSVAPCYIGEDTLITSIWRTLKAPALKAVVRFGDCQSAEGRDRRVWSKDLQMDVQNLLDRAQERQPHLLP